MKTQLFKHGFLYIIILLVITITFFGYSSDEPDEGVIESGLVGSWGDDNKRWEDATSYLEDIITFKSNSTGTFVNNTYNSDGVKTKTYKFTWSVDGKKLYYVMEDGDDAPYLFAYESPFYYEIKGDVLWMTREADEIHGKTYTKM